MKKNFVLLLLSFIFSTVSLTSCKDNDFTCITPKEAKKIMDTESNIIILDVREKYEYDEGHIEGAMLLPLGEVEEKAHLYLTDKSQKILVYCRSGRRSKEACNILVKLGYTNIYEFGGILDWPYEIVK